MKVHNFVDKIPLYRRTNPNLTDYDMAVLLLIDNLYLELPKDINEFRKIFPHCDPEILTNGHDGITFIDIVEAEETFEVTKKRLNDYINIKFNHLGHYKTYEENMKKFHSYSKIVSTVIDNILKKAKFPTEVIDVLKEREELRNASDLYELVKLYRETKEKRVRFAIMRKLGLIILLARINRTFSMQDLNFATAEIEKVFKTNLLHTQEENRTYYYWVDEHYKLKFIRDNEQKALHLYTHDVQDRKKFASKVHPIQIFNTEAFTTNHKNRILSFEIRNKFLKNNNLYYTSFVEKMLRKNLAFPNQVHDVIGIKIIVNESDDIPKLIDELETFLGGSSTRKKEKNHLNKFGKRKLSKYSSDEYFVWKAVYDIALPHPSITKVKEMIKLADKNNTQLLEYLNDRIKYFINNPRDIVVEVQIQDLKSYLLSMGNGSIPHHDNLKMTQIKENTFFKLFPKEIYKKELWELKEKILSGRKIKQENIIVKNSSK